MPTKALTVIQPKVTLDGIETALKTIIGPITQEGINETTVYLKQKEEISPLPSGVPVFGTLNSHEAALYVRMGMLSKQIDELRQSSMGLSMGRMGNILFAYVSSGEEPLSDEAVMLVREKRMIRLLFRALIRKRFAAQMRKHEVNSFFIWEGYRVVGVNVDPCPGCGQVHE